MATSTAPADLETRVLAALHSDGSIADSGDFANSIGQDHNILVGIIKSLEAYDMIVTQARKLLLFFLQIWPTQGATISTLFLPSRPLTQILNHSTMLQDIQHSRYILTEEARGYLGVGSPEAQVFNALELGPLTMGALKAKLGPAGDVGFKQAMQQKWVAIDKSAAEPVVVRKAESISDRVLEILTTVSSQGTDPDASQAELQALSKRKLVALEKWKTFTLTKGPKFALERKKAATDLTAEMLAKGTWREEEFKEYNFAALGLSPGGGYLHPLLKVRTQFRKIFTQMGFEEMPTNNYVESSFWNFDALFQPQQHPARDAHDTFFLTSKCGIAVTIPYGLLSYNQGMLSSFLCPLLGFSIF